MTDPGRSPISEAELHALVDGALPASRRAHVEAYLAVNPAAAARVAAWRAQNVALRRLFMAGESAGVDPAWRTDLQQLTARPRRIGGRWRWLPGPRVAMAAGLLLLLAGGLLGPGRLDRESGGELAGFSQAAERAYLTAAVQGEAAPSDWHPPDLSLLGWRLVSMGQAPPGSQATARFDYADRDGRRLLLLVGPPKRDPRPSYGYLHDGNRVIFSWISDRLSYALVGELSRQEMMGLAERTRAGLRAAGSAPPRLNGAPVIQSALDHRL